MRKLEAYVRPPGRAYVMYQEDLAIGVKLDTWLRNCSGLKPLSIPSRSKRPYLIRAMHEWMVDNRHTPHIVIDTSVEGVRVPPAHIKDGKIILNISETAAHNLKLTNNAVSFRARFSGAPFDVRVPMRSVLGIYARETGRGMIFSHDSGSPNSPDSDVGETTRSRPHLKIVK